MFISPKDIQHFEEINQNTFSFHAYTLGKEINKMRADRINRNVKPVCHVNLSGFHVDDASADASRGCRDKVHYVHLKDCNEIVCGKKKHKAKLFHGRFCEEGLQKQTLLTYHT